LRASIAAMLDDLQDPLRDVAMACRRHNLLMPIIFCMASPNGSLLAIRIGVEESSVLAQRFEGGGFRGPFRVMLVDQSNKAVKLVVTGTDDRRPVAAEDDLLPV
jgi:hypothetical protein